MRPITTAKKNHAAKPSYGIAHDIAKHRNTFTDSTYNKTTFLCSSEVLFDGLPKKTIKSRVKDIYSNLGVLMVGEIGGSGGNLGKHRGTYTLHTAPARN